jgi:hypothetical protein
MLDELGQTVVFDVHEHAARTGFKTYSRLCNITTADPRRHETPNLDLECRISVCRFSIQSTYVPLCILHLILENYNFHSDEFVFESPGREAVRDEKRRGMDAVSNCDSSEDTSSGHEDAGRSETNSRAPSESCGCEAASTSDREEDEAATSDGSDWSHVSASGRCASAVRVHVYTTQHTTHNTSSFTCALTYRTQHPLPAPPCASSWQLTPHNCGAGKKSRCHGRWPARGQHK